MLPSNIKIHKNSSGKQKFLYSFLLLVLFFGFFISHPVQASVSYFNPSAGSFEVGNIFTVDVLVNTEGVAINNVESVINFPADLLEIVSINKSSSIFSLWVEEPKYSNVTGILSFNGGLPTPGYNGISGQVLSIVFRARKVGNASLIFSSISVRANDGLGTDVLKSSTQALYVLISTPKIIVPVAPVISAPEVNTPSAPKISSPTHPDPDKWYSNNDPEFDWALANDITSSLLLYDRYSSSQPLVNYSPAVSRKVLKNMKDGVWYFHVKLANSAGYGKVSHFKFKIDTVKPSQFDITEISRESLTDSNVKFIFIAEDNLSGIDHYDVWIDGNAYETWVDDGSHEYIVSSIGPGKHVLNVKAFDRAGNYIDQSVEFLVEAINPPQITGYTKELRAGEVFNVSGTTYSNSVVTVWLDMEEDESKSYQVNSNNGGEFDLTIDEGLEAGTYTMWAQVENPSGAVSLSSEKFTVVVKSSWAILQWIKLFIVRIIFNITTLIILISLIILILLLIVWYELRRFMIIYHRNHPAKAPCDAEVVVNKALSLLKDDVKEQIKKIEEAHTRKQFVEADEIINRIKTSLDDADKFIKKEIKILDKDK
jgi:hypothetical protein